MSPAGNPTIVGSAEEFEDAVAEGEVLVDFYADRCAPCEKWRQP
jgi:thioredoxin-like negative regulator of GroEL